MTDIYYQTLISMGSMNVCCFRYKDVFQIYPAGRTDPKQQGEVVIIEYNDAYRLRTEKEERKNAFSEGYGHLDLLHELIALLHIISNCPCWLPSDGMSVRPGLQPKIEKFTDTHHIHAMRFEQARILNRVNSNCASVAFQKQAIEFLDSYFRMDEDSRHRINSSLFLHHKMRQLILTAPSMGIMGLISSIENLVHFEGEREGFVVERCGECSNEKYRLARRYMDFMEAYSEEHFVKKYGVRGYYHTEPEFSEKKFRKVIKDFYTRRSKIAHAGDILELDRTLSGFSMSEVRLFNEVEALTRIALFSYILEFDADRVTHDISSEQRFYEMISNYPWAIPLWDREARIMNTEAVDRFNASANRQEKTLQHFFSSVWLGEGTDFNIADAASVLIRQDRNMIVDWFLDPFWPNENEMRIPA
ncbi:hypothetical protein CBW22_12020 [Pantoea sp. VS1]|uniref:hypothetical protein n=1 Tax=Pantoea sp. VS1 TaxID=2003658 RepID=UPI000B4FF612|nr:hypothetical protein [Pantoea sp. VS1]OWS75439.1 hypothetical protein CBW22_12020 [Pantoea sp. VS1]